MFRTQDGYTWDTVTLALTAGVDLREPARGVEGPRLPKLENARFSGAVGYVRRRGHRPVRVRDLTSLAGLGGGGGAPTLVGGGTTAVPDAGLIRGLARRDSEVLAWNGAALYSWPEGVQDGLGWQAVRAAVMPAVHTTPIGKLSGKAPTAADFAMDTRIAVAAWIGSSTLYVSVYDPANWAPRVLNATPAVGGTPLWCRAVALDGWAHVLVSTSTALKMFSYHESSLTVTTTELGACDQFFDVRKVGDNRFLVAKVDTLLAKITYFRADGQVDTTYCSQNTTLNTTGAADPDVDMLAIAQHPTTEELCLVYRGDASPSAAYAIVYTATGDNPSTAYPHILGATIDALTVESTYDLVSGEAQFQVAASEASTTTVQYYTVRRSAASSVSTRRRCRLAGHAFRFANRWFCVVRHAYTAAQTTRLQASYFIVDSDFRPVGRVEPGTASAQATGDECLFSVHWNTGEPTTNRARFTFPVRYRVRVDSAGDDQYDEDSLKWAQLDFLPRLRSAQFGRCTYFAGAQVHEYDGRTVTEAGVHLYPENITGVDSGAGNIGDGTYAYRIRWARKNAQGEEVISAYGQSPNITVAGGGSKITLTIPTLNMTRSDDVYALIYRREAAGTTYYLVSSRDPAASGDNGFRANSLAAATVTWTDNLADASITSKERDPSAGGTLEPFAPPACEVIGAGRDRLWVAGGELPPGEVLPSLIYISGSGARFTQTLQTVIDRGHTAVTAFGFMGHSTLVFKEDRVYALESDGPDNTGSGSFDVPRVVLAETGAVGQESVVLTTGGLLFQSPGGIQLLASNFQLVGIGDPVAPATSDIRGAVVSAGDREVRFYQSDGPALLYDATRGEWATWTGLECYGAVSGGDGAILAPTREAAGAIWVETAGRWDDAGFGYALRFRTPWVGTQGLQRVREAALLGDLLAAHSLHGAAYYDDRPEPGDEWTWAPLGDLNDDTFGAGTFGAGRFGDTEDTSGTLGAPLRSSAYEIKRRLARQKCSRLAIEFDDTGARTEGARFTHVSLLLGRRGGLGRTPARTTT